jgi:Flagellar-associated PapD-like
MQKGTILQRYLLLYFQLYTNSDTQGFLLYPTRLNFGVVREGVAYRQSLTLTNSAIDVRRFKVKLPPSTPTAVASLQAIFAPGPVRTSSPFLSSIVNNKSNQVAPGISVKLEIELIALAEGDYEDEFRIETESDIFRVPVTASILLLLSFRYLAFDVSLLMSRF